MSDGKLYLSDLYLDLLGTVVSVGLREFCNHENLTMIEALGYGGVFFNPMTTH